jgi:hypothetical protein
VVSSRINESVVRAALQFLRIKASISASESVLGAWTASVAVAGPLSSGLHGFVAAGCRVSTTGSTTPNSCGVLAPLAQAVRIEIKRKAASTLKMFFDHVNLICSYFGIPEFN